MSADSITFSVCIPVYNGRRFLEETLESIRRQTYPHWELIVAEDASPEPSRDIVEAFAASVPQQVIYVAATVNAGTAATRDLAISHAQGTHLAFLDADDLWHSTHLSQLADCFKRTKTDFVFSGFSMFLSGSADAPRHYTPAPMHLKDLRAAYFFRHYWIQPSTVACVRDLMARVGPWARGLEAKPAWLPHRNHAEDRNFFLRVIHHGITPVWSEGITVDYRKHAGSSTGLKETGHPDRVWFYNYYGLLKGIPTGTQRRFLAHLNNTMGHDLRADAPREAAWFYAQAWHWYPLRLDRLVRSILARSRRRKLPVQP